MTSQDLLAMTSEEKRIAIAEACGWNIAHHNAPPSAFAESWEIIRPDGSNTHCAFYAEAKTKKGRARQDQGRADAWRRARFPDYLTDLNAMHEAEKTLSREPEGEFEMSVYDRYWAHVRDLAEGDLLHATAAQRADAFLLAAVPDPAQAKTSSFLG